MNIGLFILWMYYWNNKRNHFAINELISSLATGTLNLLWLWGCRYTTLSYVNLPKALLAFASLSSTNSFIVNSGVSGGGIAPFAVHYEKIRIHLRETATNSAKIHSLARKSEHLRINQIQ